MERKTNWLKTLREKANLTQEELASRLQLAGFETTRAAVSHWENGRHNPPLENALFRQAFANILRIDVNILLKSAGYEIMASQHSETAERVAFIVDRLPPDKQQLALKLVEQLQN